MKASNNFMRDEIHPTTAPHLTYWDGMRFGLGFVIANLLVLALVAGLAYGVAVLMHLA